MKYDKISDGMEELYKKNVEFLNTISEYVKENSNSMLLVTIVRLDGLFMKIREINTHLETTQATFNDLIAKETDKEKQDGENS